MSESMGEANGGMAREGSERRGFLAALSWAAMVGGLLSGYGMFAFLAGRFLFPQNKEAMLWQFVATLDSLNVGESLPFTTPSGAKIVVARQGAGSSSDDFIALSSVCPHLGCAVHWEAHNDRFFCPCHNGAFDALGQPTEGPPAAANQELTRFPLKVDRGLLYIQVPAEALTIPEQV